MASININIPDEQVQRVLDAFAHRYGWQAQLMESPGVFIPNPESKVAFAKRQVAAWIRRETEEYERAQRVALAEQLATPVDAT